MRRLLLGLGLILALAAMPAWAANSDVSVASYEFTPASVQIQPGDSVTWTFAGPDLNHSVTSDPGQSESFESDPGDPTPLHPPNDTFSHTFNAAGRFTYFCRVHPYMKGTVVVGDPGGGEPPPTGEDTTPPGVSSLEAKGGRKCKRKQRKCKSRATRVSFTLSEDARVRMTFDRRGGKSPQPLERDMSAGENEVKLSTRRVPRGRYTLGLVATDAADNASGVATVAFRVR
jgi:plastocyanin